MNIHQEELDQLYLASFRYYLGRETSATHAFCDQFIARIDGQELSDWLIIIIKSELGESLERDKKDREKLGNTVFQLGSIFDRDVWLSVYFALCIPSKY